VVNRRSSLRLLDPGERARRMVSDARLAGMGLSWDEMPSSVESNDAARSEWLRLAGIYEKTPTRFRQSDRQALEQYCTACAIAAGAAAELLEDGVLVDGRSRSDEGRRVKSPAMAVWVQATTAVRHWARELALTPDSRARQGLVDDGRPDPDETERVFGTRWRSRGDHDDLLDPISPFA
jgi:P27 family predicted phage terminase small subunit